jgi:hypothetical protein
MRLVDREQRDICALEEIERVALEQPLGRHIDETQIAASDPLEDRAVLGRIVGRVQARCRDAVSAQLRHLIAHQRDQRRHHHSEPVADERWKLIAERLAAAGRHDRQHVAARENGRDDLGLTRPERFEAERRAKAVQRGCEIRHLCC